MLSQIKKFLAEEYGLAASSLKAPDENTASSRVFIANIVGLGKVVVKESKWYPGFTTDPFSVLGKIYEVAEALKKRGVPLQTAYKNKRGKFVSEFGGSPWVVLEYKNGSQFSGRPEEFSAASAALAGFHKAGVSYLFECPEDKKNIADLIPVEKPYEESAILYRNGFRSLLLKAHSCSSVPVCDAVKNNISILDEAMAFVNERLSGLAKLSGGILHNDFNYANGLYEPNGSFVAFLDVDQIGSGPFVFDVGNTLASFSTPFLKNHSYEEFEKAVGEFLRAYHKINPLPFGEYGFILHATQRWDMMRILRSLRRHHYENNRLPELLPKITERFLPRITEAPKIFSFLTDAWIKENVLKQGS